jgi:DNA-binding transcriptional ArsR family regulator
VNANYSIIVKIFEEKLNSPLKGKVEKQLAKKIKEIKLNICMFYQLL